MYECIFCSSIFFLFFGFFSFFFTLLHRGVSSRDEKETLLCKESKCEHILLYLSPVFHFFYAQTIDIAAIVSFTKCISETISLELASVEVLPIDVDDISFLFHVFLY